MRRRFNQNTATPKPFHRLVAHFWSKTAGFNNNGNSEFGWTGALALAALPGAFNAILLLNKYSSLLQWLRGLPQFNPYRVCVPDEYFFIVYSMVITGVVTLLRWDHLLPDQVDFANLASLPISLRQIFLAHLTAIGLLAALFAIDINFFSSLLFPAFVTMQADGFALAEFAFAHAIAVLGVSAWTFLALIAIQGFLMAILPGSLYRYLSLAVRIVLFTAFMTIFGSTLLMPNAFLHMNRVSAMWWPPLWFLSLFESRIGQMRGHTLLSPNIAWHAFLYVVVFAMFSFSLSYRRHFLRLPELQAGPRLQRTSNQTISKLLEQTLARGFRPGIESACFHFMLRTLMRSDTHLFCIGSALGFGLLLAFSGLRAAASSGSVGAYLLSSPIVVLSFLLIGIRLSFEFPSALQANWPFRLLATHGLHAVQNACRKLLWIAGFVPVLVFWAPVAAHYAGPLTAGVYLCMHTVLIVLGAEILTLKVRTVPFAAPFHPSRDRLLKAMLGVVLFLLLGAPLLVTIEASVSKHLIALPFFLLGVLAAVVYLWRAAASESQTLSYEDRAPEAFVLLRLVSE